MNYGMIGALAGGIGLFLLGMRLMTDGLRLAAGDALRGILKHWTRTPLHGIAAGFLVTAVVQSSSAVTVAVIGFVNAGLLSLKRTLWVVYGSNVGTTVTAWLVPLVGFKIDVKVFALPLIGLGMLLNISGSGSNRRASIGEALAGFGLFFLGIGVLKAGFGDLGGQVDLSSLEVGGPLLVALMVGVGFLLTFLMQSSSAAMAIVLTAASQSVVPLHAAAAAVIGANLGTTSTALFSVIGATPNAIRVAAGHVLFNLLTGAAAIPLLPVILGGIVRVEGFLGVEATAVTTLAIFHTVFNVLGVVLMYPLTWRMARWLKGHFRTEDERLSKPQYLDKNVLKTPSLAVGALALELGRIGGLARDMALEVVSERRPDSGKLVRWRNAISRLEFAVGKAVANIQRYNLTAEVASGLPQMLRVAQYYNVSADLAALAAKDRAFLKLVFDQKLIQAIDLFRNRAKEVLSQAVPCRKTYDDIVCRESLEQAQEAYAELKAALLHAGASNILTTEQMVGRLELYSRQRRMLEQLFKGAVYFSALPDFARVCPGDAGDAAESYSK